LRLVPPDIRKAVNGPFDGKERSGAMQPSVKRRRARQDGQGRPKKGEAGELSFLRGLGEGFIGKF